MVLSFQRFVAIMILLTASGSAGAKVSDDYLRQSNNGEFLSEFYPEGALKRGEQGRVGFSLTIEPEGWIGSCEVTESSGFAALDRETCEIMVLYAKVRPVIEGARAVRSKALGYISWTLPSGVPRAVPAAASTLRKPDPIICERGLATGSMVIKTIQCLT